MTWFTVFSLSTSFSCLAISWGCNYVVNLQGMCQTIKARVGQSESIGQNKPIMNPENCNLILNNQEAKKWLGVSLKYIFLKANLYNFFLSFFKCTFN